MTEIQTSGRPIAVVTGAAGFIGRHVAVAMSNRGYDVYGIGHGTWPERDRKGWGITKWHQAEISPSSLVDLIAGTRPTCYIHCAGSGSVSASYGQPLADFERNTSTTAIVLDHVRQSVRERATVVVVSSAAVYGEHPNEDLREQSIRSPVSPYGAHKLASEIMCESYARCFGLRVTVVRPFSVYGDGLRKQLLWDAVEKFRRGQYSFFGTGTELRDWIHVEDAADLLCAAARQSSRPFEIYNAGADKATVGDVLRMLAEQSGVDPALLSFNGQTHMGNPSRLTADCSHAQRALSWSPQVELEVGISRYVAWYRETIG